MTTGRPRLQPGLTLGALALALIAGVIHLSLGSAIFTLNALGYFGLSAAVTVTTFVPQEWLARFYWAPRVALAGYALTSIGAWFLLGGFYALGYFTKAVEVVLIGVVALDLYRAYGGPRELVGDAVGSLRDGADLVFGRTGEESRGQGGSSEGGAEG